MKSGLKIRELREKKRMTITELASEMKVSRQTITNWEESDPFPKGASFDQLCTFFEVDASFFEVESENEKRESELVEEFKATLEFLREQIGVLNQEKAELRELLKLSIVNFLKDSEHAPEEDKVKIIQIWRTIQKVG